MRGVDAGRHHLKGIDDSKPVAIVVPQNAQSLDIPMMLEVEALQIGAEVLPRRWP